MSCVDANTAACDDDCVLVYKPGTPEARLADLLDLAERACRAFALKPSAVLQDAIEVAEAKIAEQIRAVTAEIGTAPATPEPRPFKVGDQVRVMRWTGGGGYPHLSEGARGVITQHNAVGDDADAIAHCWAVTVGGGRYGWHSDEELEHED